MGESRTIHSIKNLTVSTITQFILLGLRFLSRTIFIRYLSLEYLGLEGVLVNVFALLAVLDLGIVTSLSYDLYPVLHDENTKKVKSILLYYRKIFLSIAFIVLMLGVLGYPLLKNFIVLTEPLPHVFLSYFILLASLAVSYLFSYKLTLITANQKAYEVTKITLFTQSLRVVFQILVIYFWQSFIFYLLIRLLMEVIDGVIVTKTYWRLFPFMKEKQTVAALSSQERKAVWKSIRSLAVYRLGKILMLNTTELLISLFLGTTYVGLYANYLLITSAVTMVLDTFFMALAASVGNKNAEGDKASQKQVFQTIIFISQWLIGFCTLCFYFLLNPFIAFWIGERYLLSQPIVGMICIQFYLFNLQELLGVFRDTTGIFKQTKNMFIFASLLSLFLSYSLGFFLGLVGILLGSILGRGLTIFWYEPYVYFRDFLKASPKYYFFSLMKYLGVLVMEFLLCSSIFGAFQGNSLQEIALQLLLLIILIQGFNYLAYRKTLEWQNVLLYISHIMMNLNLKKGGLP